jgi:hypothetical protein
MPNEVEIQAYQREILATMPEMTFHPDMLRQAAILRWRRYHRRGF